ncbi:hypothetical protein TWF696_005733 [Orbilia brochopaga]|uniref:Large ribosomal subunit protein mL60 n=1 Tax=Orbilia brochopaga TaxID=3140254 RepID=A0AAV9UUY8_9PEZI
MFGAFRPTSALFGGLLWKRPWRISRPQKYRQRQRLQRIDRIVDTIESALAKRGMTSQAVEVWKAEMPTESEMPPRDKYTIFDKKHKGYRKGIHKLPKWTRVSQRINPIGF